MVTNIFFPCKAVKLYLPTNWLTVGLLSLELFFYSSFKLYCLMAFNGRGFEQGSLEDYNSKVYWQPERFDFSRGTAKTSTSRFKPLRKYWILILLLKVSDFECEIKNFAFKICSKSNFFPPNFAPAFSTIHSLPNQEVQNEAYSSCSSRKVTLKMKFKKS